MKRNGSGNGVPRDTQKGERDAAPFLGFTSLDANFLYCPNQFLDICLPHHSRGCVRLVSFLFRKTLGWRDEFGRPLQQRIPVPYQQLIEHAGISRGAIRDAIDEAVKARFIRCTQEGHAHENGKAAQSSNYELRWDTAAEFARTPTEFNGFFAGDGNRTPIPNDFFDVVVPSESLAIIRVVGAVIRKTIGYQDQFGGRRAAAPLSFTELQRRSNIADRKTIASAIRHAIEHNYIVLVREGHFDPNGGEQNRPAAYGIRWAPSSEASSNIGTKTPPALKHSSVQKPHRGQIQQNRLELLGDSEPNEPKTPPVTRAPISSKTPPVYRTVQNPHRSQSNNPTGNGSKTQLLERGYSKSTSKEQQQQVAADEVLEALREAGFDSKAASTLARHCTLEQVREQVAWLDRRTATRNRLGLLRQAILENWPEPQGRPPTPSTGTPALAFAEGFYAGVGSNKGRAIADPSANDLAAAERFITRAAELLENNHEVVGRNFGTLVREWRGKAEGVNSLVASLRSFGDKFYGRLSTQVSASLQARRAKQAEERLTQLKSEYEQYLAETEKTFRRRRVKDYARFEAWRLTEREKCTQTRFGAKHLLAHHESDGKRLEDFLAFFPDDVLSFKQWQTQYASSESSQAANA